MQKLCSREAGQVREGREQPLPGQFQQAGHHQPDLKQGASPFVLMDVHHSSVDVHAAGL